MRITYILTLSCIFLLFTSCKKSDVTTDSLTPLKPEGRGVLLESVGWGANSSIYYWNTEYNEILSFEDEIFKYENDLIVESVLNGVVIKAKYNETQDKLLEKSYFKNDELTGIRIYQWEDDIATKVEYYTFNSEGDTTYKSIRKAGFVFGTTEYYEEYESYNSKGELEDKGEVHDFEYDFGINPISSLPKEFQIFKYGSLVHENNLISKADYKYKFGQDPIYYNYLIQLNEFKYPIQISMRESDDDPDTKDDVITNNYYYVVR